MSECWMDVTSCHVYIMYSVWSFLWVCSIGSSTPGSSKWQMGTHNCTMSCHLITIHNMKWTCPPLSFSWGSGIITGSLAKSSSYLKLCIERCPTWLFPAGSGEWVCGQRLHPHDFLWDPADRQQDDTSTAGLRGRTDAGLRSDTSF